MKANNMTTNTPDTETMPEEIYLQTPDSIPDLWRSEFPECVSINPAPDAGVNTRYIRADRAQPAVDADTHKLRIVISKRNPETNVLERLHVFNILTNEIETLTAAPQSEGDDGIPYQYRVNEASGECEACGWSGREHRKGCPFAHKYQVALDALPSIVGDGGGVYNEDGEEVVSPEIIETISECLRAALQQPQPGPSAGDINAAIAKLESVGICINPEAVHDAIDEALDILKRVPAAETINNKENE